jgi:hypothetical protein
MPLFVWQNIAVYPFLQRYGPNVVDVFCSDPDVSIKD